MLKFSEAKALVYGALKFSEAKALVYGALKLSEAKALVYGVLKFNKKNIRQEILGFPSLIFYFICKKSLKQIPFRH